MVARCHELGCNVYMQKPVDYDRFSEAIRLNPKHPSAHNNLGIVLARQNRPAEAIPEFEAAVRLRPDYLEAWVNLGNAATTHGRFQQAVTAYEMLLERLAGTERGPR